MPDFSVSPSPSCGPIGDSAGPATQPIRMEETYHISDFFFTYSRFSYRNTLYKETPEDKKIAKMLIEEYI
jgi:hypothetical protein